MSKYESVKNDESFVIIPKKEVLVLACCDCGLVHNIRFTVKKEKLHITMDRNNRATGQYRRRNRTK